MTFAAHMNLQRDDDRRGALAPQRPAAPVDPFAYLAEKCRREFARRWHEENGDDYEFSPNVYGDTK